MPVARWLRSLAQEDRGRDPERGRFAWWGVRLLRIGLDLALVYASARLLAFLLVGGRTLIFVREAAHNSTALRSYLLPPLLLAMARVFVRSANEGTPFLARIRSPLFLLFALLAIYVLPPVSRGFSDSTPSRYLPLSVLREGDLDLDEFTFLYRRAPFRCWVAGRCWSQCPCESEEVGPCAPGEPGCMALEELTPTFSTRAYFLRRTNEHIVSAYPPWPALLALPLYVFPMVGGVPDWSPLYASFERLAAALITALSAVVLYAALRRLTEEKIAWLVAIVYALGTSSLSVSGQQLWQHGPSQLFIAAAIYFLLRGRDHPSSVGVAGFFLTGVVMFRPVNALVALPFVAYIVVHHPRRLLSFALWALPPTLAFLAYNRQYFGSVTTTGFTGLVVGPDLFKRETGFMFGTPLLQGLAGVLLSPARGLFIYSPILLASFAGMVMIWRRPGQHLLKYTSIAPIVLILVSAKWVYWWGGWCYGPRLLADVMPLLCLFLCAPFEYARTRPMLRSTLIVLAVVSIGMHALGAFGSGTWEQSIQLDKNPEAALWSWTRSPPTYYAREALVRIGRAL